VRMLLLGNKSTATLLSLKNVVDDNLQALDNFTFASFCDISLISPLYLDRSIMTSSITQNDSKSNWLWYFYFQAAIFVTIFVPREKSNCILFETGL